MIELRPRRRLHLDGLLLRGAGVLKEVPFTLVLVEFDAWTRLSLASGRVERADMRTACGKAKFRRKDLTCDVYFVRAK